MENHWDQLRGFLDQLFERYHRPEYLSSDPLELVHHYSDPQDQEVAALIAALLAYGNVKQIRKSVQDALHRLELGWGSPKAILEDLKSESGKKKAQKAFIGFVHRFNQGPDLVLLLEMIQKSWAEYGDVGSHLAHHLRSDDIDFGRALNQMIGDWRRWAGSRGKKGYFSYLLTAPEDGSCCKRWCMLLRWMVRKDELDLGLWKKAIRPDQLVIPLDTHTGRISQYLGLTQRKALDWKAAIEVTQALKRCHSHDPVRYDFALSRLGILDLCQKKYRKEICEKCELLSACRFAQAHRTWPLEARA